MLVLVHPNVDAPVPEDEQHGVNMVAFYIAGDVYNAGEIRKAAKQLIRNNLDWLRGRGDWRQAFGDKKDLFIEIIFDWLSYSL